MKLTPHAYEKNLVRLQRELVKLQEWVRQEGLKLCVLFEGRDAAGKGGTIKRIVERTNPRVVRVAALGTPTEREKTQWYFQRYVAHLPAGGEIVLFDRSWYNRAGVEHVMGFCTDDEYREFLHSCPVFEEMLIHSGIVLVKYWFSVSDEEQERRFQVAHRRPGEALEAEPDGPRGPRALGRLLPGQGRDVPLHRHQGVAVVGRQRRRQAARPAELHQPPALAGRRTRTSRRRRSSCRRAAPTPTCGRRSTSRRSYPRCSEACVSSRSAYGVASAATGTAVRNRSIIEFTCSGTSS